MRFPICNVTRIVTLLFLFEDCDTPDFHQVSDYNEDNQDSPQALHFMASHAAIILEGAIVVDDLETLLDANTFWADIWAEFGYPLQLKNTFDFFQRVFLSLGQKSLKNKSTVT